MKVIYARVSTDKQSCESQVKSLEDYCHHRGWEHITITDKISGSKFDRNGFNRLMHDVRKGKIDTVICYKMDRLGRSLSHLAQVIAELTSHGVALVIPSQGIDTSSSNPAARLQLNILCAVAEFERDIIRERVNAGLAIAKANGVKLGRRRRIDRDVVLQMRMQGQSGHKIAKALQKSHSAIYKILKEESKKSTIDTN